MTLSVEVFELEFSEAVKEVQHLFEQHYEECCGDYPEKFEMDLEQYLLLESCGQLKSYVCYVGAKAVGYASVLMSKHPHRKGRNFASFDAVYVEPKYRGKVGKTLLLAVEEDLKVNYEVVALQFGTMVKRDLSKYLSKLGYRLTEKIFTKHLE